MQRPNYKLKFEQSYDRALCHLNKYFADLFFQTFPSRLSSVHTPKCIVRENSGPDIERQYVHCIRQEIGILNLEEGEHIFASAEELTSLLGRMGRHLEFLKTIKISV